MLLAAPATASADVIFDPADADDLAATLAEAYTDQNVCYGWHVTVDDVSTTSESIGSNFGAGKSVQSGSCSATVEFTAVITYTSESSEAEDSASFDVHSTPPGVGRDDLLALDLDFDGLTGEDPDAVVGKAVTALPLLAADKGLANPLEAAPETGATPADAQLTDDPGSDWWRDRSGMLIWALILMAASGVLVWAVLKTSRRRGRLFPAAAPKEPADDVPLYVPDIVGEQPDPDLGPATKRRHKPSPPTPETSGVVEEPAAPPAPEPPAKPTSPEPPSTEGLAAEPPISEPPAKPTSAIPTSADPTSGDSSSSEDDAVAEPAEPSSADESAGTAPESAVDDSPKPPENKE